MLKSNKNTIKSNSFDNQIGGSVKINSGSFVVDNKWVSHDSYLFRLEEYISKVLTSYRPTFFKGRNNAVSLIVTLSLKEGIKVVEGTQVTFTTREAVPLPGILDSIPLVGIIVRQDGTNDLNRGYVPIQDRDLMSFSGTGNIEDKDLIGITGLENTSQGLTGFQGDMGATGVVGGIGSQGYLGATGIEGDLIQGETGIQ